LQGVAPRYEGVDGLAFAPDGRVFYTAYVGDSEVIWSMNSDGGDQRQLTPTRSNISDSEITVTRDGRYVVFQSNRSGNMEIWRVDIDGANLKQLTSGGANTQPSLSPDGQSIIYTSAPAGQPALWRISIAGGEAMRLTSESSSLAQVSPDGKCIAYLAHASSSHLRLMVMPFAGGEPLKSFDVPGNALRGRQRMRWTPDGTAIMYKGDDMDQGLWQQSLDQEKPQPLKGFETLLVRHLAWSFDGKSLAYTSGPNTQEIVLIENFK
jgi:TolB protein